MAGTGCLLFGTDGYNIDSFYVGSGGGLSPGYVLAAGQGYPPASSLEPLALFLDPKGTNLYSFDYNPPDALQSEFASYSFNPSTGKVTQVGADVAGGNGTLAIASNDRYAVATYCNLRGGQFIAEYQRGSDGALTFLNDAAYPVGLPGETWCAGGTAADGSGHILVEVTPWSPESPPVDPDSSPRLATYTVDDSGNLSTASTWQNMADSEFGPATYQFSPDYRYLAAAGFLGLQVFAWDSTTMTLTSIGTIQSGASCGSNSTGSGCTGSGFGNVAWDENDHLYTILGQQLLVYAVSPAGVLPAPGSPYALQNPQWVTVLPQSAP